MAKSYLTLPVGYSRVDNEPLMDDTTFETYAEALNFIQNDPTAYLGQIISVKQNGIYQAYIFEAEDTLTLIGGNFNDAIPSDDIPLMDGEGSAGTDSKYARGDHQHPSDTSKADKEAVNASILDIYNKIETLDTRVTALEEIVESLIGG